MLNREGGLLAKQVQGISFVQLYYCEFESVACGHHVNFIKKSGSQ